jgi:hypothetical protein
MQAMYRQKIWLGGRKKLKWGGHKLEKSKPGE